MAKIHTVEWTPGILANPVLERAMNSNWYGVLPRWVRDRFGHVGTEMIGGIVGSSQDHHAAPYSITEEFVSVYRLHPLLPDDYEMRDHRNGQLIEAIDFDPLQGHGTRPSIEKYGMSNLLYSFGVANPGAITLHNHPNALNGHVRLNGDRVDLGTIDVLRDRERGVRRYNDFREALRKPRIERFEDLTENPKWNEEIRDVYDGDIDQRRPPGGSARRAAAPGLRLQRHRLPDLHPDGLAPPEVRPLLHQPLQRRRLQRRGHRVGRVEHDEGRAAAPSPRARSRAGGRRQRLRALAQRSSRAWISARSPAPG